MTVPRDGLNLYAGKLGNGFRSLIVSSTHANELMRLNAKLVDTSWWLGRLPLQYTTASGIDSVLSVSCASMGVPVL